MYKNSQCRNAPVAWQQARSSLKHGFLVELFGKGLQRRDDKLAESAGQLVEECGKVIQHKSQESLMYAQLSDIPGLDSKGFYQQSVQAQVDARKAYIQALKAYTQVIQKTLKEIQKHLQQQ